MSFTHTSSIFGTLHNTSITLHTLSNTQNFQVSFIDYGCTLMNVIVDGTDMILAYDTLEAVVGGVANFGSAVGRYANRIEDGKFKVGKKEYSLPINNNANHLHGGPNGIYKKIFRSSEPIVTENEIYMKMSYVSKDNEEGYPGDLNIDIIYGIIKNNELIMKFYANTNKTTIVNLCNHAYWNLSGHNNGTIENQLLHLPNTQFYTPLDDNMIPTGEILKTKDTHYDFSVPTLVGSRLDAFKDDHKTGHGYDLNYVVSHGQSHTTIDTSSLTLAAILADPRSGRIMEISTNAPGIQLYTANWLNIPNGKDGAVYKKYGGLCLETQHFPNTPNFSHFPHCVLKPNETYEHIVVHKFKW